MLQSLLLLLLCQLSLYNLVTPAKVCGRPPVMADVEEHGFQRVYEVGSEVFLSCKRGYIPTSGSRKIICTSSGQWSQAKLKCSPKSCSFPDPLANGAIHIADIIFESKINYTCNEGYILRGANTSECTANGTWSEPLPFCEPVTCGLPEIPKYATMTYNRKFKGNTTLFGDSVMYECSPPLVLFGDERGYCTADGTWTKPPECRLVTCPPPTGIANGFMSFAVIREHGYKEKVKYGCDVNYVLEGPMETECEKTGQWSTKPSCKAPCTIGIERGRIFYNGKKIWIGDLKPNRVLHSELVALYCKNEEKNCGYPVVTQCIDGTLKIPECYREPNAFKYHMQANSLPSEIKMC
ncbi:beta-2-glycoprotein 1-like [Megalops cyprinoides]|uniref:beta-2-glycoprotein 1-like n=1 Tax=Megalops cyprinoides TaxID=118141 RepID=UPI001863A1AA|nr:beta-2-glycoprotein 1-like [Megalops cyprinoides]